jgi:hypothetical protein
MRFIKLNSVIIYSRESERKAFKMRELIRLGEIHAIM